MAIKGKAKRRAKRVFIRNKIKLQASEPEAKEKLTKKYTAKVLTNYSPYSQIIEMSLKFTSKKMVSKPEFTTTH